RSRLARLPICPVRLLGFGNDVTRCARCTSISSLVSASGPRCSDGNDRANLVIARTSARTVASAVPVDSRHRAQQPHIPRILGVPARAFGEIAQVADRVQQEPALAVAMTRGETQAGVPVV